VLLGYNTAFLWLGALYMSWWEIVLAVVGGLVGLFVLGWVRKW
jgi:hypothetical protein